MDDRNHPDQDRSARSSEARQIPAAGSGELEHVNGSPANTAGLERPAINPNEVPDLAPLVAAINEKHNTGNDEVPEGNQDNQDPEGHEDPEGDKSSDGDESSDGDQGEQQSNGNLPCPKPECTTNRQRLRIMRIRIKEKDRTIKGKDREIDRLKQERRSLQQEIRSFKKMLDKAKARGGPRKGGPRKGGPRSTVPTWPSMLRQHLAGDNIRYEKVWKQSQRELNMPINPGTTHPNVQLIARAVDEPLDGNSRQSSPAGPATSLPENSMQGLRFPEVGLPGEVLFQILDNLLYFDGSLVHCFSRLDPYHAPDHFPDEKELGDHRTGVPHRFFISAEKRAKLSLTYDTVDPNTVLAPLLVCRRWAWYGTHIFYGRNTFAFSSLGEWDRFCNGIRAARVERLQVGLSYPESFSMETILTRCIERGAHVGWRKMLGLRCRGFAQTLEHANGSPRLVLRDK